MAKELTREQRINRAVELMNDAQLSLPLAKVARASTTGYWILCSEKALREALQIIETLKEPTP